MLHPCASARSSFLKLPDRVEVSKELMAQCIREFRHNCIAAGQSSITQQRHVPLYHPPCHQAEVLKELMARCEDIRREKDEAMAALQSVQRDYDLFEVNMQRQGQVRGRGSNQTWFQR